MKGWVVFYLLGSRATLDKIYKDSCSQSLLYGMKIGDSSDEGAWRQISSKDKEKLNCSQTGSGLFHAH